jgi:3-oxoacyl-[acyl-carrier-protein] synthase II
MMRPVYILSASAISPQHSFDRENFLQPVMSSDNGRLYVIEAEYNKYINPVAIRRMSKLIKMGISVAMDSLQQAGVTCPDAIITGTAKGSMLDMERFLKDMIQYKEEALNPTFFIQSTYNSINGWVALQTKSNGYNQTFVHRGLSLELSLLDAQLFLTEEEEKKHVLAGCFDEMTEEYFFIKNKIGYWKKDIPNSLQLLQHGDTTGSIGGEGAAFFTLSNEKENSICAITGIKTFLEPEQGELQKGIEDLLAEHGLYANDIDVMLCGMNGDSRQQRMYDEAMQTVPDATVCTFKQLVGEYPTSSGFALWLATEIFRKQEVPDAVIYRGSAPGAIKHLLIVNHYVLGNVGVMLVTNF